MLARPYYTCIN